MFNAGQRFASHSVLLLYCDTEGQAFSHSAEYGKPVGVICTQRGADRGFACGRGPLPGTGMQPPSATSADSFQCSEEENVVTCHYQGPRPCVGSWEVV